MFLRSATGGPYESPATPVLKTETGQARIVGSENDQQRQEWC